MKKTLSSLLLFLLILSLSGQNDYQAKIHQTFIEHEIQTWNEIIAGSASHRGDENIDVKFYHLDIEIAIDSAYIRGNVLCKFAPLINNLNYLELDLDRSLTVTSISEPCESFIQENNKILINLNQTFSQGEIVNLTIEYGGVPVRAGGYKGLRYETHHNGEPIIATLSTPFLAHFWYPCKDGPEDKADSVYVDITIENKEANGLDFIAVSNGVLEETTNNGNYKTFKWRHRYPIVTYYVMVAISNFVKIEDEARLSDERSMPLDYYVFDEDYEDQVTGLVEIPDVIEFFNDIFGTYPFEMEKYGMTQLGYYGAIENQTNTIINSMSAATGWFMVSVHELGHMWFADMITCETWHEGWLNEGFATYSEALWTEHKSGMAAYSGYMKNLEYYEDGTLYLESTNDTFGIFRPIIYYKGAWALHMLRGIVGDSLFFKSIKAYATDTSLMYGHANTTQLKEIFEEVTNEELDYFFDEWVYDEYYPYYYYNFDQLTNQKLYATIYQAQQEELGARPVFIMPVDITIKFEDGSDTTITVWNNEQFQQFEFELDKPVDSVFIDKNNWILNEEKYSPELPVGQNETLSEDHPFLTIGPNPFTEFINIEMDNNQTWPVSIQLIDISGKLVFEGQFHNNESISAKNYPAGIYLYRITTSSKQLISSGKLIKTH